jgi:hypothetical protein
MNADPFDRPIWTALTIRHAALASLLGSGAMALFLQAVQAG